MSNEAQEPIDQKILGDKPPWFTWKKKAIVVIILLMLPFVYYKYGTIRTVNVTIASTDSKDGIFLIFTDKGTFKNIDSYWHLKFKASDVQGMAAPGSDVRMTVYGIRSGIASSYKNVLSIEKR